MNQKSFYIDSCIYLNLWQKEINFFGFPIWKIAAKLLNKIEKRNYNVYYSGFLLKELKYILDEDEFYQKRKLFETSPNFKKVKLSKEEFELARKIESQIDFAISFYDIIHMLLAKKTNSILITRDKKLIKLSKKYSVIAKKPEEVL